VDICVGREDAIKMFDNLFTHFRGVGELDGLSITAGLWRVCATHGTKPIYKECVASLLTCSGVPQLVLGQCLKLMTARAFITAACIFSAFGTMVLLTIGITGRNNLTLIILGKALVTGSYLAKLLSLDHTWQSSCHWIINLRCHWVCSRHHLGSVWFWQISRS
jgi:hypothetical protein